MIRLLVVEDSAVVRRKIRRELRSATDIEIVGEAADPYEAREQIFRLRPDVITLDLQLPRMDGMSFLRKMMRHHPLPVIVLSSLVADSVDLALEALQLGAFEVIPKPGPGTPVEKMFRDLIAAIRASVSRERTVVEGRATTADVLEHSRRSSGTPFDVIAIGASTGGVQAVETVLRDLPAGEVPGIVVVQHLPAPFPAAFAGRLDKSLEFDVREARDGEPLHPGSVRVAPGGLHLTVARDDSSLTTRTLRGDAVHFHCPSVDVLFRSLATASAKRVIGVLLTGMGSDGATGLLELRTAGAATIAQDEASSVVFGMPREAIRLGAAEQVLAISQIPEAVVRLLKGGFVPMPAAVGPDERTGGRTRGDT